MNPPDPRVKKDMEQAIRTLSGACSHTEAYKTKDSCVTCITDACYTAMLTFVARENSNAIFR